jgi:hypothetical protein
VAGWSCGGPSGAAREAGLITCSLSTVPIARPIGITTGEG